MPLFAPAQIERYVDQIQKPNITARQTVQSTPIPNPITGQESSVQTEKQGLPWPYKAGMVGANLFDGITTRQALSQNKNAVESNPLASPLTNNTPGYLAAKTGAGLLQSYALDKLAKIHPKLARGLSIASMAIPGIAGVSNLTKVK